jgi:hypothetical protein
MESISLVLALTAVHHRRRRTHGVVTLASSLWLMLSSTSVECTLHKCGLHHSEYGHAFYCKGTNGGQPIVEVYANDLFIMSMTLGEITKFKEDMKM